MRKILAIVAGAAFIAAISAPIFAADMTVKGEVVDVACSTGKGDGGKGDAHAGCAMSCAKRGQPVGILTADAIYVVTRRLGGEQERQAARLRGQEGRSHRRSQRKRRPEDDRRQVDQAREVDVPHGAGAAAVPQVPRALRVAGAAGAAGAASCRRRAGRTSAADATASVLGAST